MALMLGAPTSVECISQEGKSSFMFPKKSVIRFDFPAARQYASGQAFLARRDEGAATRSRRTLAG